MRVLDKLMALDPAKRSADGRYLETIAILVEEYERRTITFDAPTPREAILFRMEQGVFKARDIVRKTGITASRVSEMLSGKRMPSKKQILALHENLGIPLISLLGDGS